MRKMSKRNMIQKALQRCNGSDSENEKRGRYKKENARNEEETDRNKKRKGGIEEIYKGREENGKEIKKTTR